MLNWSKLMLCTFETYLIFRTVIICFFKNWRTGNWDPSTINILIHDNPHNFLCSENFTILHSTGVKTIIVPFSCENGTTLGPRTVLILGGRKQSAVRISTNWKPKNRKKIGVFFRKKCFFWKIMSVNASWALIEEH